MFRFVGKHSFSEILVLGKHDGIVFNGELNDFRSLKPRWVS